MTTPTAEHPALPGPSILTPDFRDLLEICELGNTADRLTASLLGTIQPDLKQITVGRLRAGLLWDALGPYLADLGWTVVGRIAFHPHHGERASESIQLLRIGDHEDIEVPRRLSLFAADSTAGPAGARLAIAFSEGDNGRVDVSVAISTGLPWRTPRSDRSDHSDHSDRSDHSGARNIVVPTSQHFVAGWSEHVRRHNRLRGRPLLPDGQLVELNGPCSWSALHLPASVREEIDLPLRRFLRHDELGLALLGVRRRGGLIVTGPPGTGKSTIGRILAATCGTSFLWVLPRHLQGPSDVAEVLELARLLSPTILFIEDLDLLGEDRGLRHGGNLVLGELMNQLDGHHGDQNVFTVATTNRLDVVEKALRQRPGRFDRVVTVPPLDAASCRAFLAARLGSHELQPASLDHLADRLTGATGAVVEETINTLLLLAVEAAGASPGRTVERLSIEPAQVLAALAAVAPEARGRRLGFELAESVA